MPVQLNITYCNSWGHAARARALAEDIIAELGEWQVKVTMEATPDVTGWFEVQVVDGALLHSRKNGDGFVDSQKKLDKIIQGVESAASRVARL